MYERFTDRARKVMQLANQEAQRFNHEYIGTEHVLLGIVKEGSGVAANVLKNLDIDMGQIRLKVEKLIQSGPEIVTMGKLPQTPRTKRVVECAMNFSRDLNHNYVGTEHLLLGLLQSTEGVAHQVLTSLGVTTDNARSATLELLGHDPEDRHSSEFEPPRHPWHHPETRVRRTELPSLVNQSKVGFPPFCQPQQLNPLITALNRQWRNSVLIVGERGVGKRALVERLANEIVAGHSSVIHACGKRITEIKVNKTPQRVERDFPRSSTRRLMFVENIHVGLAADQPMPVPTLSRRPGKQTKSFKHLLTFALETGGRCIATTTEDRLDAFLAHEELAAHFSLLRLSPASSEQSIAIAKSRADDYKANRSVRFNDGAYQEACELADHYGDVLFPGHAQPALILDVLEHAAAFADFKQAAEDGESKIKADVPAKELHAHDIQHIVALRLGKDIDDVKARR